MPGERSKDAAPVKLGFWMDGKLLQTVEVETKPSSLVYFSPFSETHFRVFLPAGEHRVSRGVHWTINTSRRLPRTVTTRPRRTSFRVRLTFSGPFPTKTESASRKRVFICNPGENGCMAKIVTGLAQGSTEGRQRSRRSQQLMKVAALARKNGENGGRQRGGSA